MIVLGCDPGTRACGLAVVDMGGQRPVVLEHAVVRRVVDKKRQAEPVEQMLRRVWDVGLPLGSRWHVQALCMESQHAVGRITKPTEAVFYLRDVAGILRSIGYALNAAVVQVHKDTLDSRLLQQRRFDGRTTEERRRARKAAIARRVQLLTQCGDMPQDAFDAAGQAIVGFSVLRIARVTKGQKWASFGR